MKNRKKLYWGTGAAFIVLLVMALAFNNAPEVETITAAQGQIQRTIVENGTVNAKSAHDLYTAFGGTAVSVPVTRGQMVEKDQIIMVLDNPEISMQVNSVQTQLAQVKTGVASQLGALAGVRIELEAAQKQLDKTEKLYNFGAASETDYDNARLAVEKLQNSLQELEGGIENAREQEISLADALNTAKSSLAQLIIKSPMAGKIMYLNCEAGQVIMPGTIIGGVAVEGELEVRADVLSDDIAEITAGQTVSITAPVLGDKVLSGRVIQVYPQAEEKMSALGVIQRRVPVIISLEEAGSLKPGYEVRTAVNTIKKENIIILPRETVRTNNDGLQEVLALEDNRILIKRVETGIYDSDNIEIIAGIAAGDIVIKDAGSALKEGSKVKVK